MSAPLFTRDGRQLPAVAVDAKGRPCATLKRMCTRCGGAGRSDKWVHTGLTCYDCQGTGHRGDYLAPLYSAEQLERLNAAQAKAQQTRAAKRAAADQARAEAYACAAQARAAQLATDPLFARLKAHAADEFIGRMLAALSVRDLTDGQRAAAEEAVERADARAARAVADAHSRHFGQVGQRTALEGVVEFAKVLRWPTHYEGGRQLLKLRTAEGLAVWFRSFGSNSAADDFAQGDEVTGSAEVRAHDYYNGAAQTVLTKARLRQKEPQQ